MFSRSVMRSVAVGLALATSLAACASVRGVLVPVAETWFADLGDRSNGFLYNTTQHGVFTSIAYHF